MKDKEFRYPIIFEDKQKTVLLLNDIFATDEYLEYALKHNVDVLFTQTESTRAVEIIFKFNKNGFQTTLEEKENFIDGIRLDTSIHIRFER